MSISIKIFFIVLLIIFSNSFEDIFIDCFDYEQYYLFIIFLFGFITIIFNKYDLREKIGFDTVFTKDKTIDIIITFVYIYYLLKTVFILASKMIISLYC